jgi:hypothetical protein
MNDRCPRNLPGLESFYSLLSPVYSLLAFGQWRPFLGLARVLRFSKSHSLEVVGSNPDPAKGIHSFEAGVEGRYSENPSTNFALSYSR